MARGDQFIPHLFVSDGRAALEFYKEVFGGEEGDCMLEPNGARLMHGEIVGFSSIINCKSCVA